MAPLTYRAVPAGPTEAATNTQAPVSTAAVLVISSYAPSYTAHTSLPVESTHRARSSLVGVVVKGSCWLAKPTMLPWAEDVSNHTRTVKVSGLVYSVVVSAHPLEPSVVTAWVGGENGPVAW